MQGTSKWFGLPRPACGERSDCAERCEALSEAIRVRGTLDICPSQRVPLTLTLSPLAGRGNNVRIGLLSRLAIAFAAAVLMVSNFAIAAEPIALRDMGSFHVGGRLVEITGKPIRELTFAPGGVPAKIDPNGTYQVEQMYVQYFLPANEKGVYPLLMWHGGGLTGVTWETTPDGREGWLNYFLRKGWSVYNSDAVERGRAGWAQYPDIFKSEPVFLTTSNPFQRFRIGDTYDPDPTKRKLMPGSQFPNEGYENFTKQGVPRWTTNDDATIAAYIAEIDRVCPCIIMFHSQAGTFGFKAAQARPDKVKGLIAIEPAGVGDPPKRMY